MGELLPCGEGHCDVKCFVDVVVVKIVSWSVFVASGNTNIGNCCLIVEQKVKTTGKRAGRRVL